MNRYLNLFISEFKLIRFNLYIPIIIFIFYILFFSNHATSITLTQLVLVPMSSWWIVWILEHNLKPSSFTLFKTLPIRAKKYFFIKFIIATCLYITLLSIIVVFTLDKQAWLLMLCLLIPQVLFFTSMSYLLIILTKSGSVTISIIYLYVLSEIFPLVEIPFWPHVFITLEILDYGDVLNVSVLSLLYSLCFFYLANIFLNATSLQQRYIGK